MLEKIHRNQTNRNACIQHPARAEFIRSMADELERCPVVDYFPFDRKAQNTVPLAPTLPAPVPPSAPEPFSKP
jgi:hypothetical protein